METKKKLYKGKALYQPTGKAGEYSAWAVNFFIGCSNNCTYCYCKRGVFSHFWSTTPRLKKSFKDADQAISIFEKEMMANLEELRKAGIFFSFTTDPMLDETLELTLRAVGMAVLNNVPVKILTKCSDWLDTPIWASTEPLLLGHKDKIAFGFTLTGCDDKEPFASSNQKRIDAMQKVHELGFHTFASIEPVIDIVASDAMMRKALPYCQLFKVGLMSGGAKPDEVALKEFVDYWSRTLDKFGKKVYWKQSIRDYLGDKFSPLMDSSVESNYNIFD